MLTPLEKELLAALKATRESLAGWLEIQDDEDAREHDAKAMTAADAAIAKAEAAEKADGQERKYLVIGNAGRGRQNLWPQSEKPELLTKGDAETIAHQQNNTQRFGQLQIHYHVKSLEEAEEFIAAGQPAWDGLRSLKA
jgi:hypothetical protein